MDFLVTGLLAVIVLVLVAACAALLRRSAGSVPARELEKLRQEHTKALEDRAGVLARHSAMQDEITQLQKERDTLRLQKEEAVAAQHDAEKQAALTQQQWAESTRAMQDFEAQKLQMTQAAREAVVKAGSELSSKLLEDHKREAEAARKENDERTYKVTEALMAQFHQVTQNVSALSEQTKLNISKTDTVYRALSTPGGAGQFAEIGLENSLKNLGLEAGRDFAMQYHIAASEESGRLRPDAVVFLPQGQILAVDSKASKHLLEIAEAIDEATELLAMDNLKRSMNNHLNALAHKDYSSAIKRSFTDSGRKGDVRKIINVMCLPNEAALERIKKADPDFVSKAEAKEMIVISAASLPALFLTARIHINQELQAENQEKIRETMQKLVDSVHILVDYAGAVGKGVKTAADAYTKFTASFNRTLLPKIKTLHSMGVGASKNKGVPKPLPGYSVTATEDMLFIENENLEDGVMLELLINKQSE